jgi:hypothetical protein
MLDSPCAIEGVSTGIKVGGGLVWAGSFDALDPSAGAVRSDFVLLKG